MSDSTRIKITDKKLSLKWKIFTGVTKSLLPVSVVLGFYSAYNVYNFLASSQNDYVSLALWALILVMCVLNIAEVVIFRTLNSHYWMREREFNTVSIISRTLATASDYEKQASAMEKKQEIVNEVTKNVAKEARSQIEESINKGFDGVKDYFASALRTRGYAEKPENDLLDATLKTMNHPSATPAPADNGNTETDEDDNDNDVPVDLPPVKSETTAAAETESENTDEDFEEETDETDEDNLFTDSSEAGDDEDESNLYNDDKW